MQRMEENAIVLDYLPQGRSSDPKREPLVQAIGEAFYTLLELIPRKGISVSVNEQVYIGKSERPKIDHIKGRVEYKDLTNGSQSELPNILRKIVDSREQEFVSFYNKAGAITLRLHTMELLPGVGKKHLQKILEERSKKPFVSFADIASRVELLPNPAKIIVDEILAELQGSTKYYLFCKPPYQADEHPQRY